MFVCLFADIIAEGTYSDVTHTSTPGIVISGGVSWEVSPLVTVPLVEGCSASLERGDEERESYSRIMSLVFGVW